MYKFALHVTTNTFKMKQFLLSAAIFGAFFTANAQDLPMPSPAAELEQTIGLTEVELEYSRPSMKGRTIFGDLVPYGENWRTGANASTKIGFSTDVMFGGVAVKAGEYALYTVPGEGEWEVVLNSNLDTWGVDGLETSTDVARVKVAPSAHSKTESMMFYFDDLTNSSANLTLAWEETSVSVAIEVDFMATAKENIEAKLGELDRAYSTYNRIAQFYLDNDMELEQALKYAEMSVEQSKKFWNMKTLSEAQAANGDIKGAIKTAKESLEMSQEANYGPYIKMNEENIAKWEEMK